MLTQIIKSRSSINRRYYVLICMMVGFVGTTMAQPSTSTKTLKDGFGYPVQVTNVVDLSNPMPAEKFWALVKPTRKLGKGTNPWLNPVVKDYFFGRYWTHEGAADPVKGSEDLLKLPHRTGLLGKQVQPSLPLVIADDIPFHPIMRPHAADGRYSKRYYPRRMHDWIVGSFQPAFLLTGKKVYEERILEILEFLLYSQYQPGGHNQFVKDFYPEDYSKIMKNGNAKRWRGGWDYLFDWEWLDGYGYRWSLHEPDHHVGANMALAMLQGWQMTGDNKYFKSADEFFTYQLPEYGFHSGVWNGYTYYWTQYDRSGAPKSATSATDNIQALVARTAAMLGYFKKDPVLLEYARGLLWYQVREFKTDGRWYYDGAENPMNQRRYISHEGVVLNDAISTLAYLIKAGMPVDEFLEPLGRAVTWYRENLDTFLPEKNYQAWKTFSGDHTVIYIQATTHPVSKISIADQLKSPLSVFKIIPTEAGWKKEPAKITDVLGAGEIFRLDFSGVDVKPVVLSAAVFSHGTVTKETRVLSPEFIINADNFASFPEAVHFPDVPLNSGF
ncbi:MAG TPA: hypothetical protein VGD22_05960 [Sphingobacteriaceae bacterium]